MTAAHSVLRHRSSGESRQAIGRAIKNPAPGDKTAQAAQTAAPAAAA